MSLGNDWGWTPDNHYKSARKIIGVLAEVVAKGGNMVLGVGPTAEGLIEEKAAVILREIGSWLDRCGEALYGTRQAEVYQDGNVWFTSSKDGKTGYAIYALQEEETLPETIEWTGNLPKGKVTLLNTGKKIRPKVKGEIVTLALPKNLPDEPLAFRFDL